MTKTFNTVKEMEQYMVEGKYEISCVIVDKIVESYPLDSPLEIMTWSCNEDETDYSVSCSPEHVVETLEQNLEILIEVEDYKRCHEAKKIIDKEQMKINLNNDPWVDEDEDEGYDGYSANDGEGSDDEDGYRDSDYDY